ncbi:MAG: hypothetical protein ACE5NP_11055 [Anaerolineae bacterium]
MKPEGPKRAQIVLVMVLMALLVLACGPAEVGAGYPTPPGGSVPVSAEAATLMEEELDKEILQNPGQEFRLRVTNEMATSYLALKMPELPLDRPQVWFSQGKVFTKGTFTALCLVRPQLFAVIIPHMVEGQFQIEIEKVYLGPLSLPNTLLNFFSRSITETMAEAQIRLSFDSIDVLEGELIVSGTKVGG